MEFSMKIWMVLLEMISKVWMEWEKLWNGFASEFWTTLMELVSEVLTDGGGSFPT